jgi:hypothetical protein
MRQIEVRLTGKTWEQLERHVCVGVQLTSSGDLVIMAADMGNPLGEHDGKMVFGTKLQHGYSTGCWAEFRDAGDVETAKPGETMQ